MTHCVEQCVKFLYLLSENVGGDKCCLVKWALSLHFLLTKLLLVTY